MSFYDICHMSNVINHSNMGIKRTVSIRLVQLWLLNQWFILVSQYQMQKKTKLSNFPLGNRFINLNLNLYLNLNLNLNSEQA